ncbi:unnamed protein product [Pieris macdunnoughi]|uniref:Integrase catalytic domain-containing protein n=1 Tax=Pieris macdunnoughi TaxID=345717 RepID=A0A821Y021_9NEOP|nr:unnamed protein product [Pieris macdunnoughi]
MADPRFAQIDRLAGRDNYPTWSFAVKTFLEHEDLWKCVETSGMAFTKTEDTKARSKIVLLVDPMNYVHIQDATTAKEVWDNLRKAFDDSGLLRKVGLLRELITTDLESCGSVENYVNKIITCAHKLRNIKFIVDDEWLGTLLLAGLPESYRPMIMAMESSGVSITADLVKTKILQDVKSPDNSSVFFFKFPQRQGKEYYVAAFPASPSLESGCWYIDSGAAMHMTNKRDWLYDYGPALVTNIKVADNKILTVKGCGKVNIETYDGESELKIGTIQVKNVLYVPDLAVNLLSVRQMTQNNCQVKFSKNTCNVYKESKLILTGYIKNNLYVVHNETYALMSSVHLWHQRMGHLNYNDLQKLNESTEGADIESSREEHVVCNTCLKGKQTRQPFKHAGTRASALLELVHSDVCGPMEEKSLGGARYYVTFVDDWSRKVFVYFISSKSQVLEKFKDFKLLVENQLNAKIKTLRSDNGKEYVNEAFDKVCRDSGIKRQLTIPYTPEQNGMSERMNRTLTERAKCMLINSGLPKKFWAEAVATAAYVINRSPTKSLQYKTPEELWSGIKPNISNIKVFGCRAMMHVPKEKRLKWDCKSKELIFVGYCLESKGYRLFDKTEGKVMRSRDVIFLEESVNKDFAFLPLTESQVVINEDNLDDTTDMTLKEIDSAVCASDDDYVPEHSISRSESPINRINLRPRKHRAMPTFLCQNEIEKSIESDPETLEQALQCENSQKWISAMDDEYNSLLENNTWTLSKLPYGRVAIPCRWVFKTKIDGDGNVTRYKARLVIKGYQQKQYIDYNEVYAPVVRLSSIRYLLAIAAKYQLKIEQLDAVTAFLQGDIDVELYMSQPSRYDNGTKEVCKLNKSIYGLKQASRTWNKKLDNFLSSIGFSKSNVDPCVYYKYENEHVMFITIYVDDILLFHNCQESANNIKIKMKNNFKMNELGIAYCYIGLCISYSSEGIAIDQTRYIENTLRRFGMEQCNSVGTPMEPNIKFSSSEKFESIPYQEATGCLLYISQGTRPDICYAVHTLCRYNSSHTEEHWNAVKRLFRYLQGTKYLQLVYKSNVDEEITGYSDSDWASCTEDRKSCTGYIFNFQGAAISWNSKRQQTVALSTTEAEYMALSAATQEAMWLRQLHCELWPSLKVTPITLYCDNQSAIKLTGTYSYHARSKHIDVRHHYLRNKVECGDLKIEYVGTDSMVADCLTKALPKPKHQHFLIAMGLRSREDVKLNATT